MVTKVKDVRKILAVLDDLKPFLKRGVSDDEIFAVIAKHICKNEKAETQVETTETVNQVCSSAPAETQVEVTETVQE